NGMIASGRDAETVAAWLASPAEKETLLADIRAYTIKDAVRSVQTAQTVQAVPQQRGKNGAQKRVVLFDFGAKANIRRELEKRGLSVIVVPCDTTAETIRALAPDGIMLSNGPGDPADNEDIIAEIRKLCATGIPLFGICLGHQMLALARGARTAKLTYGHRGANQPVKDKKTGCVLITSQNHGYAVENDSLPPTATLRFVNMNDGTCEGIEYTDIPAFSVQFHPEACGGPHDTNYLFDTFLEMIRCH
ncbi:MAG: carbamoyl phosphate synthase small subunit, partial [Treponemataceae bacterium]|nr:carbamoyl phosphate synthase small subunit [Treponemataceae bacterium]